MGRLESRPEEFSTQEMRDLFETVQIESLSKATGLSLEQIKAL